MPIITSNDFQSTQAIDPKGVIEALKVPVHRELLIADQLKLKSNKLMVIRTDNSQRLGIISEKRPEQKHSVTVEWLMEQIEQAGVPWKLRTSLLDEETLNLYQEYVFDRDVKTPDGKVMNPMFIFQTSYYESPFKLKAGTFRHVCLNGALTGNLVGKIDFKSSQMSNFSKAQIAEQIKQLISRYDRVGQFYNEIGSRDFSEVASNVLSNKHLPTGIKKFVLTDLENTGKAQVVLAEETDDSQVKRLGSSDFNPSAISNFLKFKEEVSSWDVYNVMTNFATFQTKNESSRVSLYERIDLAFVNGMVG